MALNSDTPITPTEVLEAIRLLLREKGSDRLKLRVIQMMLESYFSGRPMDTDTIKAKSTGSDSSD